MRQFHETLARVGLAAIERYGFVLAGGYALSANGIGNRLSMDIDLFTDVPNPDGFRRATEDIVRAYEAHGLTVEVRRTAPTLVDLSVRGPRHGEESGVRLGLDFRALPPARASVGPVLDVTDAVGNKVGALWSRGEPRDYIDIYSVAESGRFSKSEILELGDQREALPFDRPMLARRFRAVQNIQSREFVAFGLTSPTDHRALVGFFVQWADEVDSDGV
ncbi:MAG: nucleotidyl transferase AbiEii/AbiGii toxin family protein [Bifidobacteriaceae bacterium]|jgi:hypothetical protein|nr:nucleotidyl transferase AbiEii/AbiGii toxin family protein [Bifidobacteriaceae bacterium]